MDGTCLGQGYFRVSSQGELTLGPLEAVFYSPELAPRWIDEEIQPLGVSHLIGFILWLGVSNRRIVSAIVGASDWTGLFEAPKLGPHLQRLLADKGSH